VRINHEFLGSALIEVNITLWSIVQRYHSHVDRLGDMDFVVEDRLHELAIVFQDRRLSGLEGVAFGPAEPIVQRPIWLSLSRTLSLRLNSLTKKCSGPPLANFAME